MDYKFQTPKFEPIEVIVKGIKKYYIEGYISTIDMDEYGEVVTPEAQERILSQVKAKDVTLDLEHEEWYDNEGHLLQKPRNEKIPVAKIVSAELRSKGVWVKAELNSNISKFKEVWGSIKDGFLHSFSIAFYPLKAISKRINGVMTRFIEDLNLINVTLTGSPVNPNATFTPVMKAVLQKMEEENMSEEKQEPVKVEEKQEPVKVEKNNEELETLIKQIEEQNKKLDDLQKYLEAEKEAKKQAQKEAENAKRELEGPMATIKALNKQVEEHNKLIVDLKTQLVAPVLKSQLEQQKSKVLLKTNSPLDLI